MLIVLVVAAIGGILGLGFLNSLSSAPGWHSFTVVNGLVSVPAGRYHNYPFSVPSGATSIIVNGTFSASGDIDVLVADQPAYDLPPQITVGGKLPDSQIANHYYDSGQVTVGSLNMVLPRAGTYYLVFSNMFSSASSKNVESTVNLYFYGASPT